MRRLPILALVLALFAVGVFSGREVRGRASSVGNSPETKEDSALSRESTGAPSTGAQDPRDSTSRLKRVAATANANKRARIAWEIADNLDAVQIREALAELDKTHVRERHAITLRLLRRWATLEPEAAIDFAKGLKIDYQRTQALGAAVKGWMEVDPVAAREWVSALKGPMKEGAMRGLISALAEKDPKAAFALVSQIAQHSHDDLAEDLFDSWTQQNPREAADHVAQLPKGFLRDQAANIVAERWASNDVSGALAWAEAMWDEKISRIEGRSFPSGCDALTRVLQKWMEQDREGALAWINSFSDEKKREGILGTLVAVQGDRDPAQIARLVSEEIEPGSVQDKLIGDLAWRWGTTDSTGALNWAVQLSEKRLQQLVLPRLTFNMSPDSAPTLIELAERIGGEQKESTVSGALRTWVRDDPKAAASWLETQPPNQNYYYSVACTWARRDPEAATGWIQNLPPGVLKDGFVSDAIMQIEPSLGAQWINAITDSAKREESCVNLAKAWLKSDTDAARSWLATAPLNQKVKDQLLKPDAK